ncbi:2-methylfumaryl-CoA isomerase [Variovorax sp. OAS795]
MDNANLLEGMRVIEAAAFVAAPLGGMTLAQMGAEVIRIDALGGGLDYRRWPVTQDGISLFWAGLNKGKKSVTLDLGSPEGREFAMALIAAPGEDAGMLLTNFPPRGWLDHESLRERRSDLIQLTVQGDRHGGSAVDYTINPRIGLPYLTGSGGAETAVNHVLPAWDLVTGQMAAAGLLAAERHRRRQGVGQHVKLALEDVALAAMGSLGFLAEAQLGQERGRHGNHLFGAFGRDFSTSDGVRIMVVGLTGKQWRSLCDALAMGDEMAAIGQRAGLDLAREGNRFLAPRRDRGRGRTLDGRQAVRGRGRAARSPRRLLGQVSNRDPTRERGRILFICQPDVRRDRAARRGLPDRAGAAARFLCRASACSAAGAAAWGGHGAGAVLGSWRGQR